MTFTTLDLFHFIYAQCLCSSNAASVVSHFTPLSLSRYTNNCSSAMIAFKCIMRIGYWGGGGGGGGDNPFSSENVIGLVQHKARRQHDIMVSCSVTFETRDCHLCILLINDKHGFFVVQNIRLYIICKIITYFFPYAKNGEHFSQLQILEVHTPFSI